VFFSQYYIYLQASFTPWNRYTFTRIGQLNTEWKKKKKKKNHFSRRRVPKLPVLVNVRFHFKLTFVWSDRISVLSLQFGHSI
jgi:hypothetical protein